MMETIRQWLWGVIAASVFLTILEVVVPKGTIRGITKISGGLVMVLVMLQPIVTVDFEEWDWKFSDYQSQIDSKIHNYRTEYQVQMESIIEEELSAYISKKTEQMGINCRIAVITETVDHVPKIKEIRLSGTKNEELAVWLEDTLGIEQTRQYWEDAE